MKHFLLLLLVVPFLAEAQNDRWGLHYSNLRDSTEYYVFGDTAFVRADTSLNAAVTDTLFAGDNLLLINQTKAEAQVQGFYAPWVNISYRKNGVTKTGVMWGGMISFQPMRRGNTKFVFGIDRRTVVKRGMRVLTIVLKVVENGIVVSKGFTKMFDGESTSFISGEVIPGGGLDGVKHIVQLMFSGESCGVSSYVFPFAWTGTQLAVMPTLQSTGDADVYYHTEKMILPSYKGGRKNMLLIQMEEGESTEKTDKKGDMIFKTTQATSYYNWNGRSFTRVKK